MLSIILSGVLGLATSFLPEILKFFTQKRDQEHEIKILTMQMDREVKMAELGHVQKMEEINAQADIQESEALYKAAKVEITGVKWIDGVLALLNGTVRPVVTYTFVFFYIFIKIAQYYAMYKQEVGWASGVMLLWVEFDCSILMLCLSYFFGARQASKVFKLDKK